MNPCISIQTEQAWKKGYAEGIIISERGILLDHDHVKHGCYLGEIIDSNEFGHEWSRLHYDIEDLSETSIQLWTLCLDRLFLDMDGKSVDLETVMTQKEIPLKVVIPRLEELGARCHDNQSEVLLNQEKGRYLIYWFELMSEGPSDIVTALEIYYEKMSWLNYLPQIYSEEGAFLEKYLAVFQTVHEDIESVIDQMATIYMPARTEESFLEVLHQWLPVDGFSYWNPSQKREILSHYREFNEMRGTKEGILKYVSLFTRSEAFIVEYKDFKSLKTSSENMQHYKHLYTEHPFGFTLLVKADTIRNRKQIQALEAILREIVPAQVTYKIARISPYMVLGDYTFLGINSSICNQTEIKLDEQPLLSMGIIGE